jgi:hypothetical protein
VHVASLCYSTRRTLQDAQRALPAKSETCWCPCIAIAMRQRAVGHAVSFHHSMAAVQDRAKSMHQVLHGAVQLRGNQRGEACAPDAQPRVGRHAHPQHLHHMIANARGRSLATQCATILFAVKQQSQLVSLPSELYIRHAIILSYVIMGLLHESKLALWFEHCRMRSAAALPLDAAVWLSSSNTRPRLDASLGPRPGRAHTSNPMFSPSRSQSSHSTSRSARRASTSKLRCSAALSCSKYQHSYI